MTRYTERTQRAWVPWVLAAVLAAYVALGVAYSVMIPVFEYPDESHHFFVVQHIVQHRALPIQRENTRGEWGQEGSQPPLYYVVGALLVSGLDLDGAKDLLWPNPQANIGQPTSPGNKNRYIHPIEQDDWRRGPILAIHVLRFYSVLLGSVTVGLVWAITHELFPEPPALALIVAATVAFVPQFVFVGSAINNDNAVICLSTLSLYLLLRCIQSTALEPTGTLSGSEPRDAAAIAPGPWLLLGVSVGLAALAKLSALALLPLSLAVMLYLGVRRRSWAALARMAALTLVPVVVIAGWWYVRNMVLYGDLTGLSAMWEVVGRRNDFGQDLWGEFRGLRYSFWGLYGWFSILMDRRAYLALDVLSVLAVAGWIVSLVRAVRSGRLRGLWAQLERNRLALGGYRALGLVVLSGWALVVAGSLLRWTSLTPGSQGRLLFAALGSFGVLFVLGLRALLPRSNVVRNGVGVGIAVGLLVLSLCSLLLWIVPEYRRPAAVEALPPDAVPFSMMYGDAVLLHGVRFEQDDVRPGETLALGLYWESLRSLSDDDELIIWLRMIQQHPEPGDPAGGVIAVEDAYPGAGTLPTSLWPTGEMLEGRQYVAVGEQAPAPMVARLDLGLYWESDHRLLHASDQDLATIGHVKIVPHVWPKVAAQDSVAVFDCGVSLAEYRVPLEAKRGETIDLELVWTVHKAPRRDYAVFVHLEDGQGHTWGYGDGVPRGGNYSTWWWEPGEVIEDPHRIAIDPDTPPGSYRVRVGLYDGSGRVGAYGANQERLLHDAVDLALVEVR